VRQFGECFKTPVLSKWQAVALTLAQRLEEVTARVEEQTLFKMTVETLRAAAMQATMESIIEPEQRSVWGSGKRFESMSLNFPVFLNFLRNLDVLLANINGRCDIVHDENRYFESVFRQGVEVFGRTGPVDVVTEDGIPARLSTSSFRSFRTDSSKTSPALQAADILASSIFRVAKRTNEQMELTREEGVLAALSIGHEAAFAMTGGLRKVPGMGSDEDISRLHGAAFDAAGPMMHMWEGLVHVERPCRSCCRCWPRREPPGPAAAGARG
jgi:hypothetical protein